MLFQILNLIIQVGLLGGLIWYTMETRRIRKASQESAKAAIDAAIAAQENLRLLKESYEERIGQGPQIVREAIHKAKADIIYWKCEAEHIPQPPHGCPDPTRLSRSGLQDVLTHARQISPDCAKRLIDANTAMVNAMSELEKAYATAKKQSFPSFSSGKAFASLGEADELLNAALKIVG